MKSGQTLVHLMQSALMFKDYPRRSARGCFAASICNTDIWFILIINNNMIFTFLHD